MLPMPSSKPHVTTGYTIDGSLMRIGFISLEIVYKRNVLYPK
jgi:hypothetical protein